MVDESRSICVKGSKRIELLRGPEGALYDREAIGDTVTFINKLATREFDGKPEVVATTTKCAR